MAICYARNITPRGCTVYVSGLDYAWNTDNYLACYFTAEDLGETSAVFDTEKIFFALYANDTGTSKQFSAVINSLAAGTTHSFYVYIMTSDWILYRVIPYESANKYLTVTTLTSDSIVLLKRIDTNNAVLEFKDFGMDWNASNYKSAGVSIYSFTNGALSLQSYKSIQPPTNGNERTFELELNNLSAGTKYTFYAYMQDADNEQFWNMTNNPIEFTTGDLIGGTDLHVSKRRIVSYTDGFKPVADISVNTVSSVCSMLVRYEEYNKNTLHDNFEDLELLEIPTISGGASLEYTFGNSNVLSFAKAYNLEFIFYDSAGNVVEILYLDRVLTPPENPDFEKLGVEYPGTDGYFYLNNLEGQMYQAFNIQFYKKDDTGNFVLYKEDKNFLRGNKTYGVKLGSGDYYAELSYYVSVKYTVTVDDEEITERDIVYSADETGDIYYARTSVFNVHIRPQPWAWTDEEIGLFTGNGNTESFTASRWREFVTHVRTVLGLFDAYGTNKIVGEHYGYSDISWNSFINKAFVGESDKTFYAKYFNIINYAINQLEDTGYVDKKGLSECVGDDKPDTVYGEYFIRLAEAVNRVDR